MSIGNIRRLKADLFIIFSKKVLKKTRRKN